MTEKTCGHVGCSCEMEHDQLFCSESCRRAADSAPSDTQGCRCGHPECLGDAGRKGDRALSRGAGDFS